MISNKDLYSELEKIDEVLKQLESDGKTEEWAILKAASLQIKLQHNLRENMVTIMRHFNIELLKPAKKDETVEEKESE